MTDGKATVAVLRVGDRVRFDGMVQTVVGLSGTLVRLADEHGQTSVTTCRTCSPTPASSGSGSLTLALCCLLGCSTGSLVAYDH